MTFRRVIENFTCEHCQAKVTGNGYTNHCPHCLWSKHVDVHPGDRKEGCGGMMKPFLLERSGEVWVMTQRCTVCSYRKRNRLSPEDDFDEALRATQEREIS